jgi:hypothetical protein
MVSETSTPMAAQVDRIRDAEAIMVASGEGRGVIGVSKMAAGDAAREPWPGRLVTTVRPSSVICAR